MAMYAKRIEARALRNKGTSIIVIAKQLGASKSTVSAWCKDIVLTDEQFQKLRKNMGVSIKYGQRIAAQVNRQKRIDEVNKRFEEAKELIGSLSSRDLLIACTCIYWSEGSKTDNRFIFVNSDPLMIKIMCVFLTKNMKT